MLSEFCVYLAGGMAGFSREEQGGWRAEVYDRLMNGDSYYGYKYELDVFNPVIYYNYFEKQHKTEKEVLRYELDKLRKSDLLVVNFDTSEHSKGTMAEIAVAYEHRIPIIGLSSDWKNLHTWEIEMSTRICEDMDELIEHILLFYLT